MRPRPLPPAVRDRAFTVHDADRAGVSRQRLRRTDLVAPTRSLRWSVEHVPHGVDRIRAFRGVLLPGQFVSHVSAATLWDLPLPGPPDDRVHVTSVRPAAQMRRPGVVGHRTTADRMLVGRRWGVPSSTPAGLWVECGAVLALDALVALGDAIVTLPRCATDLAALAAALARRGRCPGARLLRAALDLVRVGGESPGETRTRLAIVRAGLPEPELQVEVLDERGRFVARVDMAWPEQRVVVEYDGDHHRTDPDQWAIDVRRHRALARLGWTVLRWTKHDLAAGLPRAVAELAALLHSRGRTA